ncbi:MAG: sialate O-acetylesterase [Fibrobacterota bacterium]
MVLQRDLALPIWGTAASGAKVKIELAGQTMSVKTGKDNRWQAKLKPLSAGGPFVLKVSSGKEKVQCTNVLMGDVWVCSGQSNMEFTISGFPWADKEANQADYPNLRLFTMEVDYDYQPHADIKGGHWKAAVGDSIRDFSATAFFFGRELIRDKKIPIGLISASRGGSIIESWTRREALLQYADYLPLLNGPDYPSPDKSSVALEESARQKWIDGPFMQGQGIQEQWYQPETDPAAWKDVKLPVCWDAMGLAGYKGTVWYKTRFPVRKAPAGKNLRLLLGPLHKHDIVWVNGHRVGYELEWWKERDYPVPAEFLTEGMNDVTVRITSRATNGGFAMDKGCMMVCADTAGYPSGESYVLNGLWKYRQDDGLNDGNLPPRPGSDGPNTAPALLYNGMIAPILTFGIKGMIWYQGEGNAARAFEYQKLFPNMISDWRAQWGQGDFPFLFVQLANYNNEHEQTTVPDPSTWAELREAQAMALSLPKVGMAVAIDIGEALDIHPKNKQEVGRRLALAARKIAYGEAMAHSGPMYQRADFQGDSVVLHFDLVGTGLASACCGELCGFAVAGTDRQFVWARAYISGTTVVVKGDSIQSPAAVRYGWADNPERANLVNVEGLPASPFRTDNWPGLTDTMTYMKSR